jgi:preprotein translocase subunit SecE
MSSSLQDDKYRLDWLKWITVVIIISLSVYANWYYADESVLYRVIGFIIALGLAASISAFTKKGSAVMELAVGAKTEWKKVVWPTKQERNQTTLLVLAVIVIMALLLWGIDSFFSWIAKLIMG